MKFLLATAGTFALMISATACGSADQAETDSGEVVVETADGSTTTVGIQREIYALASGEVEASDLIGASVQSTSGDEIATVADVWLGTEGNAPALILRDGGVAGVGGELRSAAFDAATITANAEAVGDEPKVIVQLNDVSIESLPAFEQATADDFRLASELIGTNANIVLSGDAARINDLILSNTGESNYAVIAPTLTSTNQLVVDADHIVVAEGDTDGELTLDLTEQTLLDAPEYPRE